MTLQCINPAVLPIPEMYTQVVVATGSKLVFVSGQQPEDMHGKLVGEGDFAAQARLAFGNLGRALAAAGGYRYLRFHGSLLDLTEGWRFSLA